MKWPDVYSARVRTTFVFLNYARFRGYDMKSCLLVTGVLSLGLLTTVNAPAFAHHGNAAYADEITEFKRATVTKFAWANPHTLINFDATDAKGTVVHMVVETAAPQALRLIGWTKTSVAPGDIITVRMYVAKNGNPAGRLQKIILADGTELHDTQLGGDAGGKTRFDPDAGK
jgi:hypothetical protein